VKADLLLFALQGLKHRRACRIRLEQIDGAAEPSELIFVHATVAIYVYHMVVFSHNFGKQSHL
jgi:hypothetical protein